MQRRRAIESILVALALLAALMPIPAPLIERWFSAGLYPHLQRVVTPVTNLAPFAWFDVILIAVIGGAMALLISGGRQSRRERSWRPLINRVWTLMVASACCYLLFLTMWG